MAKRKHAAGAVLVTGAAKRIGGAIALDLGTRGWNVAVHYRASGADAENVVREINDSGGKAVALQADLSDREQVETLVPRAAAEFGPLTALINNASVFEMDTARSATPDSWDSHIETNLHAPLVLMQAFAGQCRGSGNCVINMLDQRVWRLTPYFLSYTVSKSGLWTLTRTMALALAPEVRVNGIGPGPTLASPRQTEQDFARQAAATPLGRGPELKEICATVRFILETPSLTGQMIALDGGQHLTGLKPGQTDHQE